jgi:hypothetical protein
MPFNNSKTFFYKKKQNFILLLTSLKCFARNSFVDGSTLISGVEFCTRDDGETTVVVKYLCTTDTVALVSLL